LVRGFSPSYTEEAILVKFGIAKKMVDSSSIEVNRSRKDQDAAIFQRGSQRAWAGRTDRW